jgi:hypothetical protein
VTIEPGTAREVIEAVREAIDILADLVRAYEGQPGSEAGPGAC